MRFEAGRWGALVLVAATACGPQVVVGPVDAAAGDQASAAAGGQGDLAGPGTIGVLGPGPDEGPGTLDDTPDGGAPGSVDLAGLDADTVITVGGKVVVTASELNLRSGPGTSNGVLATMPCGSVLSVVAGPTMGWWNVIFAPSGGAAQTGWSSGMYLIAEDAFDPVTCGDPATADGGVVAAAETDAILARAKLAVGYSYFWGHGSWRSDGADVGACMGTCSACSHTGAYGADCSGFVAKCWQVPSASPITVDLHPYSTVNFRNDVAPKVPWTQIPRSALKTVDALTYNTNGEGHIALVDEQTISDPWGDVWLYEARGCATGVVHDLRTVSTAYIAIRREGL